MDMKWDRHEMAWHELAGMNWADMKWPGMKWDKPCKRALLLALGLADNSKIFPGMRVRSYFVEPEP